MRTSRSHDVFAALAQAVAYQQLSGKAAATIYGRFEQLFPEGRPDPAATVQLDLATLRSVGLSRAKSLSILDLAEKSLSGQVPSRRGLGRMSDEAVIEKLCQVRGIGPWTAQMYLMFDMGRPNIMPATDLGIQKGVASVYEYDRLPTPEEVLARTRHLAPFRTAASWYFWRAAESTAVSKSDSIA
jgi:3-methyladenine DNA glycosylase/8-oxoguanine DNA glycosylase